MSRKQESANGDKQVSNNRTRGLKPRWKPGQSGNPKGRPPKMECLTSLLKDELERIDPADKKKRTWRELVVLATLRLAIVAEIVFVKPNHEETDTDCRLPRA